ncbi:ATP-binding protein [Shewanella sp. 1_MG-2023]|uniref:ATP-binding protein n=1 Tax=unclassified Shewanella TaxID=196818 RepID=UPI0026E3F3A4|nr:MULTISPECIES: ATP-binding protein [unclassified Shewanella]MDO6610519.1 ATP-binding protein [Shewanella sp. 7_MG-2023]MDO6770644.1 ATP-binding protein [Shewanella sp. 2_MG-2023]MDO6795030.1 ATP-binding protein [Shewanella sp. 1_MG-2023]
MSHSIIPASLAIKSMRDNGYKSAAHAIAELIDNSIQAKAKTVQLICIDGYTVNTKRKLQQLEEIAILDDGIGMSPKVLQESLQFGGSSHRDDPNGIGKFGMGLPNASISQCRRVDVWSWKNGKSYKTYLDVDLIESGDIESVPTPVEEPIPTKWLEASKDRLSESGTLIVWSKLDRVTWKTSKSIYTHSELLVGRMYRHFINEGKCQILFKSYIQQISLAITIEEVFKVNDPLYLLKDTSLKKLPSPYESTSFFKMFEKPQEIEVELGNGKKSIVTITYSYVNKECHSSIRSLPGIKTEVGGTDWGKHCANNTGISIVRSKRELELANVLTNGKPQERWWGVEVAFEPALDEFFGVTNNKQAAVNFEDIDLKKEAHLNGYEDNEVEFIKVFKQEDPYRWYMYEIVSQIKRNIKYLRKETPNDKRLVGCVNAQTKTSYAEQVSDSVIASRVAEGYKTKLEEVGEKSSKVDQISELAKEFEFTINIPKPEANKKATETIENNQKLKFLEAKLDSRAFFDVAVKAGVTLVTINEDHEFYQFYIKLPDEHRELLKLLLSSWARCEGESMDRVRRDMKDIRANWGRMLSDFFYDLKT